MPSSWTTLVTGPLASDADAWQRVGWADGATGVRRYLTLARYGGFRATFLHRLAHWGYCVGFHGVPTIASNLNHALHGIELTPSVPVGDGLYMPHATGTVITADRIGANVELQGGITIGQRKNDGFPTIGDGAMLAAGCRVLGPVHVGDGATVGANSVVVRDVDPGDVVVGIPARPLRKSDRAEACEPEDTLHVSPSGRRGVR